MSLVINQMQAVTQQHFYVEVGNFVLCEACTVGCTSVVCVFNKVCSMYCFMYYQGIHCVYMKIFCTDYVTTKRVTLFLNLFIIHTPCPPTPPFLPLSTFQILFFYFIFFCFWDVFFLFFVVVVDILTFCWFLGVFL